VAFESDCSLLLGAGVQLVISCTIIEVQVVFKVLLALITGQLAIVGQLGQEVHLWRMRLFVRSRGQHVEREWFGR